MKTIKKYSIATIKNINNDIYENYKNSKIQKNIQKPNFKIFKKICKGASNEKFQKTDHS